VKIEGLVGPKRLENLPLGWFSAQAGPEGPGPKAKSRFLRAADRLKDAARRADEFIRGSLTIGFLMV